MFSYIHPCLISLSFAELYACTDVKSLTTRAKQGGTSRSSMSVVKLAQSDCRAVAQLSLSCAQLLGWGAWLAGGRAQAGVGHAIQALQASARGWACCGARQEAPVLHVASVLQCSRSAVALLLHATSHAGCFVATALIALTLQFFIHHHKYNGHAADCIV